MGHPDHQRIVRHCSTCGEVEFTAVLVAVVIDAPGMAEPLNLTPNDKLRICDSGNRDCDARWTFVTKCASAHELSRNAGPWTWAALVFRDGRGFTLKAKRREIVGMA